MLRLPLAETQALQSFARNRDVETCAVGLVLPVSASGGERFVVRQLDEVPDAAYAERTASAATLKPEFCIEIANRARAAGAGVLLAHTHPGESALQGFSSIDNAGERALASYFERRVPNGVHFAAVFTASGSHARRLGQVELVPLVGVGRVLAMPATHANEESEQYDRQVRAFGVPGQRAIQGLTIAIVGLGGTGSIVAQQLAYLGARAFVLVDPDKIEATNLNRLVGALPSDVGALKVDVAARHIAAINPSARCTTIVGDVLNEEVAARLTNADFIFGCTDSMASRALLNQLAYQCLIPCIDMGVGIGVLEDRVQYITGRTQMLSPGLPCLVCTDKLDAEQVRRELMTEDQRKRDPYIVGAQVPQPAVISLNSTMSSAAITMFLAAVTGVPSDARMLIYDGIRGSLRPAAMAPRPHCIACSYDGALARGSTWDLPKHTRGDHA
ncbi:HesA/MoeB/ThiF family protein [Methylibium sp.]|uniref:HesA/MoeB/ThiF family protein n=1 Tax=Methylibium sp. TaxID=2067992 RepID=UPI003BAA35AD